MEIGEKFTGECSSCNEWTTVTVRDLGTYDDPYDEGNGEVVSAVDFICAECW